MVLGLTTGDLGLIYGTIGIIALSIGWNHRGNCCIQEGTEVLALVDGALP